MIDKVKGRECWIDIAKGIGIILVVLGHVTRNENLIRIIYSFHMPLFFFLSGWIINRNCGKNIINKQYIKKKFANLILPFFEYRIILVLYWYIVEYRFRELDVGPIWFLPVMFFSYMIIAFIMPYIKSTNAKRVVFLFFALLAIAGLLVRQYVYKLNMELLNEVYVNSIRVLTGCSWMTVGMKANDSIINSKKVNCGLVFGIAAIVCVVLSFVNGDVSLFNLQFGKSYILYFLEGICGITAVLIVSKVISSNRLIEYLGQSSMIIMAFHEPIKRVLFVVYDAVVPKFVEGGTYEVIRTTVTGSVILTTITLVVCVSVVYIFRKLIGKLPDNKWREVLFAFMK